MINWRDVVVSGKYTYVSEFRKFLPPPRVILHHSYLRRLEIPRKYSFLSIRLQGGTQSYRLPLAYLSWSLFIVFKSNARGKCLMAATLCIRVLRKYYPNKFCTFSTIFWSKMGVANISPYYLCTVGNSIPVHSAGVLSNSGQFGCRSTCSNARRWRESDTFIQHGNFKIISFLRVQGK
jgi:hypothetical protein